MRRGVSQRDARRSNESNAHVSQDGRSFYARGEDARARLRQGYGAAGRNMIKNAQVTPTFRKTAETFSAGAKTLPQQYFVSKKIFEEERNKIFSRQWVVVGHQSQID